MFVGFLHIFGAEFPPIDSLTQVPHRFAGALLMPKQIVLRGQLVFCGKRGEFSRKGRTCPGLFGPGLPEKQILGVGGEAKFDSLKADIY